MTEIVDSLPQLVATSLYVDEARHRARQMGIFDSSEVELSVYPVGMKSC